jgi:uncharacterized protein (TIGR03435 family)
MRGLTIVLLTCGSLLAQTPSFDVASVKALGPPEERRGGDTPMASSPSRLVYSGATLKYLLTVAYQVKQFQVTGPAWLDSDRFEIIATMPPETPEARRDLMLQDLLADRFHVMIHREQKAFNGYALVQGKNGPKLTPAAPSDAPAPAGAPVRPTAMDANKFVILDRPDILVMMTPVNGSLESHLSAKQQNMSQLADLLGRQLSAPVVDETQLNGEFDFKLLFAPALFRNGEPVSSDSAVPDIFQALPQQLGLRLESRKLSLEVVVVDQADRKPVEN